MTYIENNNGYTCFDEGRQPLFSDDNSHKYLFDYADMDISILESLFEDHVSKRLDITTFQIINPSDNRFINKIKALLKSMHPYYEHEIERVIVREIGKYFNKLLAYSLYVSKNPNLNPDFEEKWYIERFYALLPPLLSFHDYPEGLYPSDFYHNFINWTKISKELSNKEYKNLIFKTSPDNSEHMPEHEFEILIPNMTRKKPCGFFNQIQTHKDICNMLYFVLDESADGLKTLTPFQRLYLYNAIYDNGLTITRHFSFQSPESLKERHDNIQAIRELEIFKPLYEFNYLNISHIGNIPHHKTKDLNRAIEYAKLYTDTKIYEEYEIKTIYQLLYLEILSIVQSGKLITKCKNCGKYFLPLNPKNKYCSRIDKNGKSCKDIGSNIKWKKNLENDRPLALYTRARKTHHARIKKGKITKNDFDIWEQKAQNKLAEVRAGKLDIITFEEWLKI